jgi:hypothetical protein
LKRVIPVCLLLAACAGGAGTPAATHTVVPSVASPSDTSSSINPMYTAPAALLAEKIGCIGFRHDHSLATLANDWGRCRFPDGTELQVYVFPTTQDVTIFEAAFAETMTPAHLAVKGVDLVYSTNAAVMPSVRAALNRA